MKPENSVNRLMYPLPKPHDTFLGYEAILDDIIQQLKQTHVQPPTNRIVPMQAHLA